MVRKNRKEVIRKGLAEKILRELQMPKNLMMHLRVWTILLRVFKTKQREKKKKKEVTAIVKSIGKSNKKNQNQR